MKVFDLSMKFIAATLLMLLAYSNCAAQIKNGEVPDAEKGTGVDEKLGEYIDLGIYFRDDKDRKIKIGDIFDGQQPVVLSFNYSNCPKLCSVQLENMATSLRKIDFKVKDDFQVISISIDPLEQVSRARESKKNFVAVYGDESSSDGWHFLTGKKDSIEVLAENCGFKYKYIPHQKLYSHPPVFILLSPDGKIVRYIHGLNYEPVTIKRALVEAAEGKIGSSINRFTYITGCFLFDESTGKYTAQTMGIMRIAGAITVFVLVMAFLPYWFLGAGRRSSSIDNELDSAVEVVT